MTAIGSATQKYIIPGPSPVAKALSAAEKKDLSASAEEAIAQIDRLHDTQELEARGIPKIIRYGIAFSGRHVEGRVR